MSTVEIHTVRFSSPFYYAINMTIRDTFGLKQKKFLYLKIWYNLHQDELLVCNSIFTPHPQTAVFVGSEEKVLKLSLLGSGEHAVCFPF